MSVVGEECRIGFLTRRDGLEATIAWVWRTLRIYRAAVLDKKHHASSEAFRRNFLQSCCDFRRWLSEMRAYGKPLVYHRRIVPLSFIAMHAEAQQVMR